MRLRRPPESEAVFFLPGHFKVQGKPAEGDQLRAKQRSGTVGDYFTFPRAS
jgi:hypothetical protein